MPPTFLTLASPFPIQSSFVNFSLAWPVADAGLAQLHCHVAANAPFSLLSCLVSPTPSLSNEPPSHSEAVPPLLLCPSHSRPPSLPSFHPDSVNGEEGALHRPKQGGGKAGSSDPHPSASAATIQRPSSQRPMSEPVEAVLAQALGAMTACAACAQFCSCANYCGFRAWGPALNQTN